MSGHSKWSKVKHQKEVTDQAKGKIFTKLANAISIAVRESGGNSDSETNFKLRLAIDKARSLNMPKENIKRAIERVSGSSEESSFSEIVYEAFGPGGVGLIIQTITENRQRTVAEIKNILDRNGGVLASSGAVKHFFTFLGQIILENHHQYDEVMELAINSGALDIEERESQTVIYTQPTDLHKIKIELDKKNFIITNAELTYRPNTLLSIQDAKLLDQIKKLITILEEQDEVQKVYTNIAI